MEDRIHQEKVYEQKSAKAAEEQKLAEAMEKQRLAEAMEMQKILDVMEWQKMAGLLEHQEAGDLTKLQETDEAEGGSELLEAREGQKVFSEEETQDKPEERPVSPAETLDALVMEVRMAEIAEGEADSSSHGSGKSRGHAIYRQTADMKDQEAHDSGKPYYRRA